MITANTVYHELPHSLLLPLPPAALQLLSKCLWDAGLTPPARPKLLDCSPWFWAHSRYRLVCSSWLRVCKKPITRRMVQNTQVFNLASLGQFWPPGRKCFPKDWAARGRSEPEPWSTVHRSKFTSKGEEGCWIDWESWQHRGSYF